MMSAPLTASFSEFRRRLLLAGILLAHLAPLAAGQSAPAPITAPAANAAPAEALRPALSQVNQAVAGLNVSRWKAPGEVRSVTQRDIDSIQRDIGSTLPPLIDKSNVAPVSVASCFAVYRNIDALYDVLLRVSETATLAGSQTDANTMQTALSSLEAARRDFGDAILTIAGSREQELVTLRTAAAAAQAAATAATPVPEKKTVVEDGPDTTSKKAAPARHKKKPAAGQTADPSAANPGTSAPNSQ